MSDVFIQKIEEMTDIVAIYTAIRQFEMEYAKLVAEIRKQDEKKSKEKQSIWVEASKEYIFKHLHEKIRVQEIADYLHLNSSYLSELFKQQESMTLTDFILQEKVKLTKNLLTALVIFMGQSLAMSVIWILLESPDLAITEAAVGAGITSLLLFVTLKKIHAIDIQKGTDKTTNNVQEGVTRHGEDQE